MSFWGKKCLVVVSGASRGLGRAVALALASEGAAGPGSHFVLLARDEAKLEETAEMVRAAAPASEVTASVRVVDNAGLDLDEKFKFLETEAAGKGEYEAAVVVS